MKNTTLPEQSGDKMRLKARGLSTGDFATFFSDIHGEPPFPWQQRLIEHVLNHNAWPKIIDLPTGTGKTAVLDVAVFAMAAKPEVFPRRVVFVVDRRIVVDQVYLRAELIHDKIKEAKTPTLQLVKNLLSELSNRAALEVAALRGGVPIDNEWTRYPDCPWVVVSTVDQFGSRLLFRGYGVSRRMRPVHAGLAGNDCLVILDEVHLSVPFAKTLGQIVELKSGRLPRRFAVVEMSATPSNAKDERFTLDPETDLNNCKELSRRVRVRKKAKLVGATDAGDIPDTVLKIIQSIGNDAGSKIHSLGIVVNLVRTARETYLALKGAGYSVYLITGRMRPLDRVYYIEKISPVVDPESKRPGSFDIVVATQAIEVGADFSFDAMITECAPVSSLRQRFGRLDRRGKHSEQTGLPAQAWIIGPKSIVGSNKPDPVYGASTKATWKALRSQSDEGSIEVGSLDLRGFAIETAAPTSPSPSLQKTHIDAWVQTNPEPLVQPDVEWFLHGMKKKSSPEVSMVWRTDRTDAALKLVPPRQAESLSIPIGAARAWLSEGSEANVADLDQEEEADASGVSTKRKVDNSEGLMRWNGFDKPAACIKVDEIQPGDMLVVDPALGGLTAGTWDPMSKSLVSDLGDLAQLEHRRRATMRLDPRLPHIGNAEAVPVPSDETEADRPAQERIAEWLSQKRWESCDDLYTEITKKLDGGFVISLVGDHPKNKAGSYYVISEKIRGKPAVDIEVMDGSDESGSMIGTDVSLKEHLNGVAERARQIARCLYLDDDLVNDLHLAGSLHDIGKVDPRFQRGLVGGDPIDFELLKEPLAKSRSGTSSGGMYAKSGPGRTGGTPKSKSGTSSGSYPTGMRHEVASIAMLESNAEILNKARDKDLVLHLISTHHGWCRPLPPIIEDKEPQELSYTFDSLRMEASSNLTNSTIALETADRFWRLVERYGYYGLAWLESILRLADHQRSARGF